jgi:enterochelin esterase-like enzyme
LAGAAVVAAGGSFELLRRASTATVLPEFPHARPGPLVSGSFYSRARRRTVGWTISYPPRHLPGDALPVCVVLHGFASDHRYAFQTLQLQVAQAQLVSGKALAPLVLASVDGGDSYWHPRRDGDDPIAMILNEYLPLLAARNLATQRIGVLGWSMGGYGALLLAELSTRVTSVAAESPAIWPSYEVAHQVNATAFDSAADWQHYSVMARASALRRAVVRVDCGLSDPFLPASQALVGVLHRPSAVVLSPGGHDASFWAGRGPAQLRFMASRLG